eukprot:TRINITY_DN28926_c0_g1_i1.p1 TRINITY_DN28926_c0_g1~~TRINITY_DN28926_c0_g1_i1.p1  ORF type:complete len:314 (+),score=78.81 TRINITY_DN28926_c0_g1_i1:32-973(+)
MASDPDAEVLAAAAAMESRLTSEAPSAPVNDLDCEGMELKLKFKMALDELHEDGIAGLPPYRLASGKEIPAGLSPLLKDDSMARYLKQAAGDVEMAAQAVCETLRWRQLVFPQEEPHGRPVELLQDGRRFRELGPNQDGDLVFALDFCWGHFYDDEEGPLNCLRMVLLAAERACEAGDAIGHPTFVLIVFGGPPPCIFAQACYKFLDKHYPERLKTAVVYPLPSVWATVVSACLYFLGAATRQKMALVSQEVELIEAARLGQEQLPEDWRGGLEAVDEKFQPDKALLQSLVLEYLNPFGESGDAAAQSMEGSW